MRFETHVARYADHEVYSSVSPKLPTLRLFDNDKYALGVGLHKWKNESTDIKLKGEYIAVYVVCDFEESWSNIDLSNVYNLLQNDNQQFENIDMESIENGTFTDERIYIYKFSVNVWRRVEFIGKKVKKWTFVDTKPDKDMCSKVQRLLDD